MAVAVLKTLYKLRGCLIKHFSTFWTMSKCQEFFYMSILFTGTIISLSPLFALNHLSFYTDVVIPGTLLPGSFLVIIIPAADLMLDFISQILFNFCPDQKACNKQVESSVVIRLSDRERFLFMVGVAFQSAVYFVPNTTDPTTAFLVSICCNNCSVLLTLGPIAIFLQRCTTTFTHLRTSTLLITLIIGLMFFTVSSYYRFGSNEYNVLATIGRLFVAISGILFSLTTFLCAKRYITEKLDTVEKRDIGRRWLRSSFRVSTQAVSPIVTKKVDSDDELYSNYIPALHMLSVIIIGLATISVEFASSGGNVAAVVIKSYFTLAAEIMVLVIELRIRKNEIARGLVSQWY